MESTLFLVPAYSHQKELSLVLEQLSGCDVLVVDDGSPIPITANVRIIRHPINKGYGSVQKTGFSFALSHGYERVALVHGDNQYSVACIQKAIQHDSSDVLLGSRLIHSAPNMPTWRRWGNRLLTGAINRKFGTAYTDFHTGARIYSGNMLKNIPYFSFADDFLFDQQMLLWCLQNNIQIAEFPIPAKYDQSVSSISFVHSIRYGFGCLIHIGISHTSPPKSAL